MSKTIICPDVHLGRSLIIGKPGIANGLNSRIIDQSKLLDWVLEQTIENNAGSIIFTGDICEDSKPDFSLINIFVSFLKKCEHNSIDVHIVLGNHDLKRTGSQYISWLDLIDASEISNVHIHKYIDTIYKEDVCFTLLPFRDRRSLNCDTNANALAAIAERLPYELADIPNGYDRVLIGHLALEGAIYVGDEIDDAANELMCPLDMFNEYDYVIFGHVHKPQVLRKKPYICHIGSLDISDFGETDHNKIIILFDTSAKEKLKEIKVPTRPLRKIMITVPSDKDSTDYIIEQLQAEQQEKSFKDAIVKIEIKLLDAFVKNSDRALIEKNIYSFGAYYICNISESRNITVVPVEKQNKISNSIAPKSAIKIWADQCSLFANNDEKALYIAEAFEIIEEEDYE
jgi:DNA repair exonuclease SbcCD nuclease subunit